MAAGEPALIFAPRGKKLARRGIPVAAIDALSFSTAAGFAVVVVATVLVIVGVRQELGARALGVSPTTPSFTPLRCTMPAALCMPD